MNTITKTEKPAPKTTAQQPSEGDRKYLVPAVNIAETKEGYLLEAEMPGVNKSGLEILLEGNDLTLVGRRDPNVPDANLLYRESHPHGYRRSFVLDPAIDIAKIEARMENGLLRLFLPKADSVKPRKVTISD